MLDDTWGLDHPAQTSVVRMCPVCGSHSVRSVPVTYGLIRDPEFHQRVERGEIVWGGCVVGVRTPLVLRCDHCDHAWAPEAKTLAAHLAKDHGHVEAEFSDYPPAPRVERLKWRHFTLHNAPQSGPATPSAQE